MSYFVTGGTGFIGQHLVELLLKRRGKVFVLVRKGSEGKLEKLKARVGSAASRIVPDTASPRRRTGSASTTGPRSANRISPCAPRGCISPPKHGISSTTAYSRCT